MMLRFAGDRPSKNEGVKRTIPFLNLVLAICHKRKNVCFETFLLLITT
jgi:hypothetical protein